MSDLRERFERHQAGLLNIDYEELRDQFDRHEEIFGKRYVTFSDFEKEFELWQACWNHQQAKIEKLENELSTTKQVLGNVIDMEVAKVDNLKAQLNNMEACYVEKKKQAEACAALAAGWSAITWDKTTHWTEGYEEGCYHCSGQIEEALRGAND
jgi:chromosome segregation ATPase